MLPSSLFLRVGTPPALPPGPRCEARAFPSWRQAFLSRGGGVNPAFGYVQYRPKGVGKREGDKKMRRSGYWATSMVLFLLCLMYLITYIDRVNIATAALAFNTEL